MDESKGYIKTTGFYIVVPGDEFHCSMRAGNHVRDMVFAMKQKIREAEKLAEQSAMVARQDEAKKEEIREAIGQVRAVFAQMEKYQTRGRQ